MAYGDVRPSRSGTVIAIATTAATAQYHVSTIRLPGLRSASSVSLIPGREPGVSHSSCNSRAVLEISFQTDTRVGNELRCSRASGNESELAGALQVAAFKFHSGTSVSIRLSWLLASNSQLLEVPSGTSEIPPFSDPRPSTSNKRNTIRCRSFRALSARCSATLSVTLVSVGNQPGRLG